MGVMDCGMDDQSGANLMAVSLLHDGIRVRAKKLEEMIF